jgi:hypothetical protein
MPQQALNEWWLYVNGPRAEALAALRERLPSCRILDTQEMTRVGETAFVLDVDAPETREAIRAWQEATRDGADVPGKLMLISEHGPRTSAG